MTCHVKQQRQWGSTVTAALLFVAAVSPVASVPSEIINPRVNYHTSNATSAIAEHSVSSEVSASIESISAVVDCVLSTEFMAGEECLEFILPVEPYHTTQDKIDDAADETDIVDSSTPQVLYERGLALVGHLSELSESSKDLTTGFRDEKKRNKSLAALHAKWQSMHSKAQNSLRHALRLYNDQENNHDGDVASQIHQLLDRLGDENDLAPPSSSSTTSSMKKSASTESVEDLVEHAHIAMDRGMHFVHHMKEMVEAAGVYNGADNNDDEKQRKHAIDVLARKWSSVHDRALQSLKEALQLFLRARQRATSTTATDQFEHRLRLLRDILEEVRNGDEVVSSSSSRANGKKSSDNGSTGSLRGARVVSPRAAGSIRGSFAASVM